jgi:18S rRNA (guanine1575-N7)-methyltransferase
MLALPEDRPSYILDIGCGSGLSGEALEAAGHYWTGMDISSSMLAVANDRDTENGDLIHHDIGLGLPFRPGSFDGVISVSVIQWLCYSESKDQDPKLRLNRFFSTLYTILKRNAKAILQFYPENPEQAVLIMQCASRVGFAGGLVVDYPNSTKAKKYYLCLSFERSYQVPTALGTATEGVETLARSTRSITLSPPSSSVLIFLPFRPHRKEKKSLKARDKDWILQKKERRKAQGKETKSDSKYTARKRRVKF